MIIKCCKQSRLNTALCTGLREVPGSVRPWASAHSPTDSQVWLWLSQYVSKLHDIISWTQNMLRWRRILYMQIKLISSVQHHPAKQFLALEKNYEKAEKRF